MKQIELKDIGYNKMIVALKSLNGTFQPIVVKVKKIGARIWFVDSENYYHITELMNFVKGVDINGKLVRELLVFDSVEECQKWCDFENEIRKL